MCGVSLPSPLKEVSFRRCSSFNKLQEASPGHCGAVAVNGLKPSKSAASLVELLDSTVVAELATLRATLDPLEHRSAGASAHSSGEDTSRGSPTSGYDQLLRSRSPSAVLFSEDVAAAVACADKAAQQSLGAPAAPYAIRTSASKPAATTWSADLLAEDHPFLESSANFNVVEVPAASSHPAILASVAPSEPPSSISCSPLSQLGSSAATVAAAVPIAAYAPIDATLASQPALVGDGAKGADGAEPSRSSLSVGGSPPAAASSSALAFATVSPFARMAVQEQPSIISHSPPHAQLPLGGGSGGLATEMREASALSISRRSSVDCTMGHSAHLSEGHAAEELFYRLNHARQTVDFVKRQAHAFSALNKATMGVWEALELLNTLREYESALLGDLDATPDMPLLEHALQCAEACRAAFPDEDYMHLAGLLAPLGKLLAHAKFGAEPQFAICGETFPVGCRFHPAVRYSQYFSANPDRRKRLYNSPTGVYRQGCGLGGVLMSWGMGEYLHLVLRMNGVALPPEALFCIRHQKLRCVFQHGAPYSELLSEFDRVQLPRLQKFQQLCQYRRMPRAEPLLVPVPGAAVAEGQVPPLQVAPAVKQHYDRLIAKYIPQGVLHW